MPHTPSALDSALKCESPLQDDIAEGMARALAEYHPPSRPGRWEPKVDDVLQFVDLDIAYSPVYPEDASMPVTVQKCNDGSYIAYDYSLPYNYRTDGRHTFGIDEKMIRRWRARFLVMRDEIFRTVVEDDYSNLPELARHSVKMSVLPAFRIFWTPEGGLREAIVKHYRNRASYVQADGSIASFGSQFPANAH